MIEKKSPAIEQKDIEKFLEKRGFWNCKNKFGNILAGILNFNDKTFGKEPIRNYNNVGKEILMLHNVNDTIKNGKGSYLEIYKISNLQEHEDEKGHYISKKNEIQQKSREQLYDLIDTGNVDKKAFYLGENIKNKEDQKKIRDQWKKYKDNNVEKFKSDYEEGKLQNRPDKHIFVLTDEYIDKIQQKTGNLTKNQMIQLEVAFLITQQAFSRKMRKDGSTPYFKHIKGVLDNLLMLEKVSFEQVMIAILHDNLEDIDHHNYDMLNKLFGKKIAEGVLALTEKKWYHRIGFLPAKQRVKLQSIINHFVGLGKKDYLDEENIIYILSSIGNENIEDFSILPGAENFIKKYNKISSNNFEGLKEKDTLPPTVELELSKMLKSSKDSYNKFSYGFYDQEFRNIFQVSKAISEFRYLDKKLNKEMFKKTDELLVIKFSDRIHNLSTLRGKKEDGKTWDFSKPSKRAAKLLETEYHFTDRKDKDKQDEKTLKERLSNLKVKKTSVYENEENILPGFLEDKEKDSILKENIGSKQYTHYEILKNQIDMIKTKDPAIKKICEGNNSLYDQAKKLYWEQSGIIKEMQKLRNIERENNGLNSEEKSDLKKYYEKLVCVINDLDGIYKMMDKNFKNKNTKDD